MDKHDAQKNNSSARYRKLSDPDLWRALTGGDKPALEALYRRYFVSLLNYGKAFGADEELVKDCIQDLFIKIYRNKELPAVRFVKSYLFRALRNGLWDKQESAVRKVPLEEMEFEIRIEDTELAALFTGNDDDLRLSRQLKNALAHLTANQRNAIYLYYIQEFSWAETAAILKITPHSAMNLVGRAVIRLYELMEEKK